MAWDVFKNRNELIALTPRKSRKNFDVCANIFRLKIKYSGGPFMVRVCARRFHPHYSGHPHYINKRLNNAHIRTVGVQNPQWCGYAHYSRYHWDKESDVGNNDGYDGGTVVYATSQGLNIHQCRHADRSPRPLNSSKRTCRLVQIQLCSTGVLRKR